MLRRTALVSTFKGVLRRHRFHADGLPLYNDLSKNWLCREGERWWILDAKGEQLPRVAATAAWYIAGQHRADFTPGMFAGDNVVIINCKDVVMVGDDWVRVPITWHTAWPGGRYRIRLSDMYERDCCMLMWYYLRKEIAEVHGRKLKSKMAPIEKAWVYEDAIHPHGNMSPTPIAWRDLDARRQPYVGNEKQTRWKANALMK